MSGIVELLVGGEQLPGMGGEVTIQTNSGRCCSTVVR